MTKMQDLQEMARHLRTAYAAEALAMKTLAETRQRQSYWRSEIVKALGQEEAHAFLTMLREQAGFLDVNYLPTSASNLMRFDRA